MITEVLNWMRRIKSFRTLLPSFKTCVDFYSVSFGKSTENIDASENTDIDLVFLRKMSVFYNILCMYFVYTYLMLAKYQVC